MINKITTQNNSRTNISSLFIASLIFWLPVIIFSKIAGEVVERQPILLDDKILHWIHAQSTPFYGSFFLGITTLGNVEYIAPLAVTLVGLLWFKQRRTDGLIVFFSFFGAGAANIILKLLFHRQRPSFWHSAITETGYSFPSGHAMLSSALAFSLITVFWSTRWRWLVTTLSLVTMFLIGVSRLYMGVHYPSDIIAGWSVSLIWCAIVLYVLKKFMLKNRG